MNERKNVPGSLLLMHMLHYTYTHLILSKYLSIYLYLYLYMRVICSASWYFLSPVRVWTGYRVSNGSFARGNIYIILFLVRYTVTISTWILLIKFLVRYTVAISTWILLIKFLVRYTVTISTWILLIKFLALISMFLLYISIHLYIYILTWLLFIHKYKLTLG